MPEDTPDTSGGVLDKLAGKAKQVVGNIVGNETLAEEGSLQERKADTALDATRLAAEAEQAEREADLAAEQEQNRLDQARVEAELAEQTRADQIEREEAAERAAVADEAARKEAAAAQAAQAEQARLDRKQAEVVADRIDGAQKAAQIEQDARRAEATADALDAAQQQPRPADEQRMTMDIAKLRRDTLALWLQGLRLPLTAAEAILRPGEDTASWPPAIAFEKIEAAVKEAVGNVVRDDTLVAMARLQRAEVSQREEALTKRADAEATRAEARGTAEAKAADVERQREQTERAADERGQRIDEERRTAEQQVAQKAARKRSATRKQAAARKAAVETAATKAESDRLRKEAATLRAKKRAVAAQGEVRKLDRKVQAKKAVRRAADADCTASAGGPRVSRYRWVPPARGGLDMASTIRAALVQTTWTGDKETMIKAHEEYAREAASQGAKVICFQELFYGPYFCQVQEAEYYEYAESIPGPTTERFQALAAELEMVFVLPMYEQEQPGMLYNTAAVVDADGSYLGKYRKHHIPQVKGFWEKFYFRPGNLGFPVFDTAVGKVGVYICYDRHFPEGWRALGLNGAEIVFNPSATHRGLSSYLWKLEQPASAVANEYFVGAINRVGIEDLGDNDFYGTSYFVDPEGKFVGEPADAHEPELVVRDLDMDLLAEVRNRWAFYRDRRPEEYGRLTEQ